MVKRIMAVMYLVIFVYIVYFTLNTKEVEVWEPIIGKQVTSDYSGTPSYFITTTSRDHQVTSMEYYRLNVGDNYKFVTVILK